MTPQECFRLYERALVAHDLEAALAQIDDNAVFLFSNESSHIGKDAIREALAMNFSLIRDETYSIQNLMWLSNERDQAVAVALFEYKWSGMVNSEPRQGGGRGTVVFRRHNERWGILHEHLSHGALR